MFGKLFKRLEGMMGCGVFIHKTLRMPRNLNKTASWSKPSWDTEAGGTENVKSTAIFLTPFLWE